MHLIVIWNIHDDSKQNDYLTITLSNFTSPPPAPWIKHMKGFMISSICEPMMTPWLILTNVYHSNVAQQQLISIKTSTMITYLYSAADKLHHSCFKSCKSNRL